MNKKNIFYIIIIIIFSILIIRFLDIRIINHDYYLSLYDASTERVINNYTAPRGRIIDRNGNIIVDNKKVPIITYRKLNNISKEEEIKLAYELTRLLNLTTEADDELLKEFYLLTNNTDYLLTSQELEDIEYRRISDEEVKKIKLSRINAEINNYSLEDKIAINTYYLLNEGYYYDTKIVLDNTSNEVCALVIESNISGVNCSYKYERVNNYDTLKQIVGQTAMIQYEDKDYYLNLGYAIDEIVGISGLELYYEELLHGTPAKYLVKQDNTLELLEEEKQGQDLILNIDINIQLKLEEILKENIENAKNYKYTNYYNTSYAIISDPTTGEILAISGLQRLKDNNNIIYKDVTRDIITSSFTVGSVIKGASHTVGYLYNAIEIGEKINDSCVKLYNVPEKCSYKKLGYIDDITALKTSSNYYQFITAIKTTGNTYKRNMQLEVTIEDFNRYRDVFKRFGLGSSTYIDYPGEVTGITGSKVSPDLLLNFAIGQYDTYTPLQLLSYINTISNNGIRYNLSFKKNTTKEVDNINLDKTYLERIQEGFYQVVNYGTARGYISFDNDGVGKTGTAQNYYDGKTTTINQTFVGYFPRNNPKYSLVVVSPNISYETDDNSSYYNPTTRNISRSITNYLASLP